MKQEYNYTKVIGKLQQHRSKHNVHADIIDDLNFITQVGSRRGKLRLLTLPADTFGFESTLLNSNTHAGNSVEEIVGVESRLAVVRKARPTLKALRGLYPKVTINLLHTTDYKLWEPNANGGSEKRTTRSKLGPKRGYDMIWLDWMNNWGPGTHANFINMAREIKVFERAWEQGRPGLLYFTLNVGQESHEHVATLRMAMAEYGLSNYGKEGAVNYHVRARGLGAYLNYLTKLQDVHCLPCQSLFYKEHGEKRRVMYLAGFHVFPGQPRRDEILKTLQLLEPRFEI